MDKTICDATENRQLETRQLAKEIHNMVVIGGKNSSNTKELVNVAKEYRGQIHYLTVTNPDKGQTNYYGDFGCKQGRICLATLTMENIYNMCKVQNNEKQGSMFSFSWF